MQPFTLPHFRDWAADLILDNEQSWHPEDWQEAFLDDVFAGTPECWLIVPEGNGKTTLLAGLALYHSEFKPFASVPVAASSREQAEIMYRQAEGFVLRSPRLVEVVHSDILAAKAKQKTEVPRFVCLEGHRRIVHADGSRIQIMSAEDRTGDGVIPTLGLIDEMHRHRDLSLYRTWSGKLRKRGGQIVGISTAGEPGSDFETTREKIRQTIQDVERNGSFVRARSPRLIFHEWAVREGEDVEDMAVVKAANPFSGVTETSLAEKFSSETMTLSHWKRFTCNIATRNDTAAITEAEWFEAKTDERIPEGQPIWLGLDVAWKWDTTAMVPLLLRGREDRLFGPAVVLTPPRDGNSLDPALVEGALLDLHKRNPIHTVVMDTSRAEQLGMWIEETLGAEVIDRQQTNALAVEDYDRFMEALRNGWMHHAGDAGLTQHALNAIARQLPQGDTRFDRPSQSRSAPEQERRVIDALVAAAMVHTVATAVEPTPRPQFIPIGDPPKPGPRTFEDEQAELARFFGDDDW